MENSRVRRIADLALGGGMKVRGALHSLLERHAERQELLQEVLGPLGMLLRDIHDEEGRHLRVAWRGAGWAAKLLDQLTRMHETRGRHRKRGPKPKEAK